MENAIHSTEQQVKWMTVSCFWHIMFCEMRIFGLGYDLTSTVTEEHQHFGRPTRLELQ